MGRRVEVGTRLFTTDAGVPQPDEEIHWGIGIRPIDSLPRRCHIPSADVWICLVQCLPGYTYSHRTGRVSRSFAGAAGWKGGKKKKKKRKRSERQQREAVRKKTAACKVMRGSQGVRQEHRCQSFTGSSSLVSSSLFVRLIPPPSSSLSTVLQKSQVQIITTRSSLHQACGLHFHRKRERGGCPQRIISSTSITHG